MQTGRASKKLLNSILNRIVEVSGLDLELLHWNGRYAVAKASGSGHEEISAFLDGGEMLQWLDGFQTCLYSDVGKKAKLVRHSTR